MSQNVENQMESTITMEDCIAKLNYVSSTLSLDARHVAECMTAFTEYKNMLKDTEDYALRLKKKLDAGKALAVEKVGQLEQENGLIEVQQATIKELREKLTALTSQIDDLTAAKEVSDNLVLTQQSTIDETRITISKLTEDNANLYQKCEALNINFSNAVDRENELATKVHELTEREAEQEELIAKLEAELADKKSQAEKLEADCTAATERALKLSEANDEAASRVRELTEQLEKASARAEQAEARLDSDNLADFVKYKEIIVKMVDNITSFLKFSGAGVTDAMKEQLATMYTAATEKARQEKYGAEETAPVVMKLQ